MLHVYILLLTLLITTVQLINCEYSTAHGSHDENNITLMTENNTIYTYNPKPPKALRLGKGAFGDALIGKYPFIIIQPPLDIRLCNKNMK